MKLDIALNKRETALVGAGDGETRVLAEHYISLLVILYITSGIAAPTIVVTGDVVNERREWRTI